MGIDIGAAFNGARKFIDDHNPATEQGRANIGKDTVKTVGGVTKAVGGVGNAVGNFFSPPAQAPTIFPVKRQDKADRQRPNPQGSYHGDIPPGKKQREFTPERPPVGRNPVTKKDGYLPRPGGADSAPLAPGQTCNRVDATGKLVTATGTPDGRTVYTNQLGKQYILPAGAKPSDYKMDARPDKLPTLRLQAQADIAAQNGAVHTTPSGIRFFIGNPDRRGQRTVIEIDKSGQAVEGVKARLYTAAKSNSAIVKRLDSENPDRGAIGNTLVRLKRTEARQSDRVNLVLSQKENDALWVPLGGLLKLGGFPQLENAVNQHNKDIASQQATLGVDGNTTLEKATSFATDVGLAYVGGGVMGKVGTVASFSGKAKFAVQLGVPAMATVGTDAANNELGVGTLQKIAISNAFNLAGRQIPTKTLFGQAVVNTAENVGTQITLGGQITTASLGETLILNIAGGKGARRSMAPSGGAGQPQGKAVPPLSIDVATRNLKTAVAQHREGRGSVEAVSAARLASVESYKAHKSTLSPAQRRGFRDAAASSDRIIPGVRTDTSPTKSTATASIRPNGTRSTATVAGGTPQPDSARPLPAAVAAVATRLGLPVADVQLLRDSLGGTFGAKDAVDHLQSRSDSPLDAALATELVKTIRSAQNESTRRVIAATEAALARGGSPGEAQSVFTKADWDQIEPLLNAQPALDNAAARRLRSVLQSGRVDPQAKEKITDYLESVGDEFTVPAGRSTASEAVPTSNLSTTDAGFSKLLIATGQSKAQVAVGVVDLFGDTAPGPNVLFNSQAMTVARRDQSEEHGHGVTSLVGKAGRWVNIKTVSLPLEAYISRGNIRTHAIADSIDQLAAQNVRVINMSLGPEGGKEVAFRPAATEWRAAMARHPDVLFTLSAGNNGMSSMNMSFARSIAAGMPNVIYVGNVDAAGNLAKSSTYGETVDIYAPGEDRRVARGPGKAYGDVQGGTSLSDPEVTAVAAKMLVLCPTLKPAAVRTIIKETASAPPIGATDFNGSVARAGILNGDAATKVAALRTMAPRVGGLENAANAMKLSEPDRSRLLPIAQSQLALASSPERSAPPTSDTRPVARTGGRTPQTTTPADTLGARVHRMGFDQLVNGQDVTDEQIGRLTGHPDATLIDAIGGFGEDLHSIYAASSLHGDSIELDFPSMTNVSIGNEPLLWRAGLSDPLLVAKAETRALAIMATQAQALGLTTISIVVRPGTARASEWAERGFSIAFPDTKYKIDFDLTSGSQSWRQLVQKVKSLGIELPAGLPADALSANDAATR